MAATQGVYSRLNTTNGMAVRVVTTLTASSTSRVITTLSLAMKPLTRAVTTCQLSSPMGRKMGAMTPAIEASMLPTPFSTTRKWKSNFCKNQMTMVARKMMVKARCRKSLVLSHSRCPTFLAPGMR